MNPLAFLIDFGSTYTKVIAVDLRTSEIIGRSQAPSTVLTDVREGLVQALAVLHERHRLFDHPPSDLDILHGKLALASSSAAGGLKMAVIGLFRVLPSRLRTWRPSALGPKWSAHSPSSLKKRRLRKPNVLALI